MSEQHTPYHTDEQRAKIIALVLAGYTTNEIAHRLGLRWRWVQYVRQQIPDDIVNEVRRVNSQNRISNLVEEFLTNILGASMEITKVAYDKEWVRQQSAGELGTFFGIMADKGLRLLEAAEHARVRAEAMELARTGIAPIEARGLKPSDTNESRDSNRTNDTIDIKPQ